MSSSAQTDTQLRSRLFGSLCMPVLLSAAVASLGAQVSDRWPVHAPDRPQPQVVAPAPAQAPVPPPSDAIILFDGRDLAQWQGASGGQARWKVENGYFEVVARTGSIASSRAFGDMQLHIQWATPAQVSGSGQERGNSGIHLMGLYEVQVLDSYRNTTYPDGQAAAIYGQFPPLVNASRAPGEWQTYDILFRAPRFDSQGRATSPARITLIHNGVLVQDNVELSGPTGHYQRPPYRAHDARLPITLQDHGNPVRFRNIWVRDLVGGSQEDL
jgi:hypothetical protein